MGISNVAIKTFDSSGSQSLCRTNEYKGDEEVKSSFISKCQKMYISGSGETVIPGSLRTFPTVNSVDKFYVNSDTDAISDITFDVEFKFKRPSSGIKSLVVDSPDVANTYSQGETVTLEQEGATGGTGTCGVDGGGVLTAVYITDSGYGYNTDAGGITIKKSDDTGAATGTATLLTEWNINVSKDIILGLIDKVEIKSGSLTVQTLTADDIYIRNLTELGQPFTFNAPFENPWKYDETTNMIWWNKEDQLPIGNRNVWKHVSDAQDVIIFQASCSLPFIGRSRDMSRSLLQAGALTNALTITVHYNNIYSDNTNPANSHYQIISAGDGFVNEIMTFNRIGTPLDFLDKNYFKSNIKVRTHIITNTEKDFISKNIIHKVLNTSANVTKEITKNTSISNVTDGITEIEVDLENVSINVSHLLIGVRMPHVKDKKLSLHSGVTLPPFKVNLYNETQSNELSTPFSVINPQTFYKPNGNRGYTPDAPDLLLGYMPNAIESMELVLGSDRTGFINGSASKIGTCENFNLVNSDKNSAHYIITLAENAFDTAGVPFSKINNKKLLIKLNNYIFKTTGVSKNPLSDATYPQNAIVTVTACGTKVQSVVGGSMSFL